MLDVNSGQGGVLPRGSKLAIAEHDWPPNRLLNVYLSGTLGPVGTVTSDSTGHVHFQVTVPEHAQSGRYSITVNDPASYLTPLASGGFDVRDSWLQDGAGPEHSGYNPNQYTIRRSNVRTIHPKWEAGLTDGSSNAPIITRDVYGDEKTVVAEAGTVAAYYTVGGNRQWLHPVSGDHLLIAGDPDHNVYATSTGGQLQSMSVDHGTTGWTADLGLGQIQPESLTWSASGGGTLILTANRAGSQTGGVVLAYDTAGHRLWQHTSSAAITQAAVQESGTGVSSAVFAGTTDGQAFALSTTTGAMLWSKQLAAFEIGRPAVSGDTVVFAASTSKAQLAGKPSGPVGLYALATKNGAPQWSYDSHAGVGQVSRPAIANGVVYAGIATGAGSRSVQALSVTTGSPRWTFRGGTDPGSSWTDPAVANGIVFLGVCAGQSKIAALGATDGALLSVRSTASCPTVAPVNERVFYAGPTAVGALGFPDESGPGQDIDDNDVGTGPNQINYSTGWHLGVTFQESDSHDHYSYTANSTATVHWTGDSVAFSFTTGPDRGVIAFSVDGGPETLIDQYTDTEQVGDHVWVSPPLAQGPHTITFRVAGRHQPASTSSTVSIDDIGVG